VVPVTSSGAGGEGGGQNPGALGMPCQDGSTCDSGHCVQGVCCNDACDSSCQSCTIAGDVGYCSPLGAGEDPQDACVGAASCDGFGACGYALHRWSAQYGDARNDQVYDLAISAAGDIVMAGAVVGSIDFGGGPRTTDGSRSDAFVAKLGPDGAFQWSPLFGEVSGDTIQIARAVAVDSEGYVIFGGEFAGEVSFGGTPHTATGDGDAFVARLTDQGAYDFSQAFSPTTPTPTPRTVRDIVLDADDNIYVSGSYQDDIVVGSTVLPGGGGGINRLFVAKIRPTGSVAWATKFAVDDAGSSSAAGIAIAADGGLVVAGSFNGAIDFGDGERQSDGGFDVFVVKLVTEDGSLSAAHTFGSPLPEIARAMALDAQDNLYLAGVFQGELDFGGAAVSSTAGAIEPFLVQLDPEGGHVWSKSFPSDGHHEPTDIAIDSTGNLIFSVLAEGSLDLGGGELGWEGGTDIVLAKLTSAGTHIWSRAYGDDNLQQPTRLGIFPGDDIGLAGNLRGAMDFGGGPLETGDSFDIVFARLGP
jgi:hypothetical protein